MKLRYTKGGINMKKALPILSMISAFCCALGLLFEIFPVIVEYDLMLESITAYLGAIVACITLILWLILGNRKHKITALITIILEVLQSIAFSTLMPLESISIHRIILYGLVVIPMIGNIICMFDLD